MHARTLGNGSDATRTHTYALAVPQSPLEIGILSGFGNGFGMRTTVDDLRCFSAGLTANHKNNIKSFLQVP